MIDTSTTAFYRYLHETLGIKYLPKVNSVEQPAQQNQIIWQHPHFNPQVIFFNQDAETEISDPAVSDLLTKIKQAMNLDIPKVWYVDSQSRSFMDFLNWLKTQDIVAPLVVMKNDPDIQNFIQNAGAFNWVECFSLQAMLKQTSLKKPTWQVLKLLLEKK